MIVMLTVLAVAAAPQWQDLDMLDREVAIAAGMSGAVALPVDRRLRLARCPEPLAIAPGDAQSIAVRCPTVGWKLRIRTEGGAPVRSVQTVASEPPIVRRGDPVTLSVPGAGFAVQTSGTAMDDARQGSVVRVRLDGGNRQISGIVTGPGEILLGGLNTSSTRSLPGQMQQIVEEDER